MSPHKQLKLSGLLDLSSGSWLLAAKPAIKKQEQSDLISHMLHSSQGVAIRMCCISCGLVIMFIG